MLHYYGLPIACALYDCLLYCHVCWNYSILVSSHSVGVEKHNFPPRLDELGLMLHLLTFMSVLCIYLEALFTS